MKGWRLEGWRGRISNVHEQILTEKKMLERKRETEREAIFVRKIIYGLYLLAFQQGQG